MPLESLLGAPCTVLSFLVNRISIIILYKCYYSVHSLARTTNALVVQIRRAIYYDSDVLPNITP